MTIIKLWIITLVMSVISWFVLKMLKKPVHFAWVLLFWVAAILGTTALLYGLSVWFVSEQ